MVLRVLLNKASDSWSAPEKFFLPGLKLTPRGVNPSQIESPDMHFFCPKSPDKVVGPYIYDFRDFKVRSSNGCSFQGFSRNFPKFGVEVSLETYYWPKKNFENSKKNLLNKIFKTCFSRNPKFRTSSVVQWKRVTRQMKALGLLIEISQ